MIKGTGQIEVNFPTVQERRQRYRQEMIDAILSTARGVMQEQGVSALSLNEVARRLGVSGQALAKYFPSKATLYDTLFLMGHRLFREAEEEVWQTTRPDWERIRLYFQRRLDLAFENPDLYYLIWERTVPGFIPSEACQEDIRKMLAGARRGIGEFIEAQGLDTGVSPEQVVDILMAARHGIVAETMGKKDFIAPGSDRFRSLIPDTLAIYKRAWAPQEHSRRQAIKGSASPEIVRRKEGPENNSF